MQIFTVIALFGGIAVAQGKPKIALYIANDKLPLAQQEVLTNKFLDPFTASGLYSVIDRSNIFLNKKTQEMLKQMSGDVKDKEIARIGQEAGAKYVCIVNLIQAFGNEYNVSARLVDVETAEIYKATGQTDLANLTGKEVDRAAAEIFNKIHGGAKPAPTAVTTPTPAPAPQPAPVASSAGTGNTFTDSRDGKTYRTVKIGNQVWMAENLNYQTGNSWCYDDRQSNCNKYGRLYDWNTAMKACPAGWVLPTRNEWNQLVNAAGGNSAAGTKLKSKSPDWNGEDAYGFSALPGGLRNIVGSFNGLGSWGHWWAATRDASFDYAYLRGMKSNNTGVSEGSSDKSDSRSVRCLQD
jgi:uncharacterized protein (TIGR02145 family)